MNRHLNPLAIVKILDALNIRRKAALLSLPYMSSEDEGPAAKGSSLRQTHSYNRQLVSPLSAERVCNDLVESAISAAIELQPEHAETAEKGLAPSADLLLSSSLPPLAPLPGGEKGRRVRDGGTPVPHSPTPYAEIGSALEGRRLQGLSFDGLRFTASFNRSDLSRTRFRKCYAAHSTFNLARLTEADFTGAQLHSCSFVGTEARRVSARNCRFSHCQFRQCDLRHWDVRGATFFRCSFTLSDLCGWAYDGQTVIIEPVDWSRCRRLAWHVQSEMPVGDCRVVGSGAEHALSLPPAVKPGRQRRHPTSKRQRQ